MRWFVFLSIRRRHTRCALVTGVQTCALPICDHRLGIGEQQVVQPIFAAEEGARLRPIPGPALRDQADVAARAEAAPRSEDRRVGKECDSKCRSRWSPYL